MSFTLESCVAALILSKYFLSTSFSPSFLAKSVISLGSVGLSPISSNAPRRSPARKIALTLGCNFIANVLICAVGRS